MAEERYCHKHRIFFLLLDLPSNTLRILFFFFLNFLISLFSLFIKKCHQAFCVVACLFCASDIISAEVYTLEDFLSLEATYIFNDSFSAKSQNASGSLTASLPLKQQFSASTSKFLLKIQNSKSFLFILLASFVPALYFLDTMQ